MRRILAVGILFAALAACLKAEVPKPGQLLPLETLFVLSVPNWEAAKAAMERSAMGRLWHDPALASARDNFKERFWEEVGAPLEKELGVSLADYAGLLQGQLTFAVTQSAEGENAQPGVMLLIDTQDHSERLGTLLSQFKQKWVESGKQLKSERIRDVEFSTLIIRDADAKNVLGQAFQESGSADGSQESGASPAAEEFRITFGQSESLLLIGNSAKALEKVLIRQSGGLIPALDEQSAFEIARSEPFREASGFGWVHFAPIYEKLMRQVVGTGGGAADNPLSPRPDRILAATGLGGLKSIAFRFNTPEEGMMAELFLDVPRGAREGVFKAMVAEAKDASPPPSIPGDALKFIRWRLDGKKAWDTLEAMLTSVSPEFGALVQMGLATAGKDKDPNFDLRRNLLGNLGDDMILYQKAPRSATLDDLSDPPSLFLVGSPNPEELAQAVGAVSSLLPIPAGDSKTAEREFLGRKIYSIPLPSMPSSGGATPVRRSFSFAAVGGYLALSADTAMLEELIRGGNSVGKPLRETEGLGEAAQRIGGMGSGFFGYENQRENLRVTLETFKNDMTRIQQIFSLSGGGRDALKGDFESLSDWIDLSSLPSFDAISKYFYLIVYNGVATAQGLSWKLFAPAPPP